MEENKMRFSQIRRCEVINIRTCRRLGYVVDMELDIKEGIVKAFLVPATTRFCWWFTKYQEYVISWCDVRQIGEEIILVDIDEEKWLHSSRENER